MRRRAIPPVEQLFTGGASGNRLAGEYGERKDILRAIQRRHEKGVSRISRAGVWVEGDRRWKVPYGVRAAFDETLTFSQIASKYPFYVQWQMPSRNGRGPRTMTHSCMSLGSACAFITRHLTRVDPDAFVVVKTGFHIPAPLRGKFPRRMSDGKTYYWCPRCMQPRRFRRPATWEEQRTFYADKKFWNDEKGYYEWKNVKLAEIHCDHCGITNRDAKFRASNQPWEKIKLRGAPRTRRRRRKR